MFSKQNQLQKPQTKNLRQTSQRLLVIAGIYMNNWFRASKSPFREYVKKVSCGYEKNYNKALGSLSYFECEGKAEMIQNLSAKVYFLFLKGELQDAKRFFDKAIKLAPENKSLLFLGGIMHFNNKEYPEALAICEKLYHEGARLPSTYLSSLILFDKFADSNDEENPNYDSEYLKMAYLFRRLHNILIPAPSNRSPKMSSEVQFYRHNRVDAFLFVEEFDALDENNPFPQFTSNFTGDYTNYGERTFLDNSMYEGPKEQQLTSNKPSLLKNKFQKKDKLDIKFESEICDLFKRAREEFATKESSVVLLPPGCKFYHYGGK